MSQQTPVVCRSIGETDHQAVAILLARGFPGRSVAYWLRGFERQRTRMLPPDVPRYGYLLESEGRICGALLLIYSQRVHAAGAEFLQCHLSSWFVDPAFRGFAPLLTTIAQRSRAVTFVNVTPAPNTWPIIEAQGFQSVCSGIFVSCPALASGAAGRAERVCPDTREPIGMAAREFETLKAHAALGCLSLICRLPDGPSPLILAPFRIRNGRVPLPAMRLIYARGTDDYRKCAPTLGRYLLARGRPFVLVGADAPIPGVPGYFTRRIGRRYVRGPHPPHPCDITDSELVLFGV